ncbi:hypothetical protein [Mangrovivirga cuniculi]|uniref:Uncharacterized protein n=1 Tax=Mangrovivirga cuniculi TaxID=2715131 RepID=A0A4D7JKV1_9BACT|nr:hypothetical protein [Mangrovivirga cuniculi]QCK15533.1 hypothetical protein DCC35_12645 [Mangrovivirga cuniculi]
MNYLGGEISAFWQEGERNPFDLTAGNNQALIEKSELRSLSSTSIDFPVFEDSDLRGISWPYFIAGAGRMTVLPFEKTYDLILKNEQPIYDLIWYTLINKVSYEEAKYPEFLKYPYISTGNKEELFIIVQDDKVKGKSNITELSYLPYLSIIDNDFDGKGWGPSVDGTKLIPDLFIYDGEWPEFEYLNNLIETNRTIQAHNRRLKKDDILVSNKMDPGWLSVSLVLAGLTLMWAGPKV